MLSELDVEVLERAWADRAIDPFVERLGVKLDEAFLSRLEAMIEISTVIRRKDAILAMGDAQSSPARLAFRQRQDSLSAGTIIAVIVGDRITVGFTQGVDRRGDPKIWPELNPWSRELARNRARVEQWASVVANDRCAADVVRRLTRTTDDAEAIAGIVNDPDDDAPRLVFADILQSRSDPRGDFIVASCLLASEPHAQGADVLVARIGDLRHHHEAALSGAIAEHVTAYELRRGLVAEVTINVGALGKYGAKIFAQHPIETVHVQPLIEAALNKLGQTKSLTRIRHLVLAHDAKTSFQRPPAPLPLESLGKSANFTRLEALSFDRFAAMPGEWRVFFATLNAPSLHTVMIATTDAPSDAIEALAKNERVLLRRLRLETKVFDPTFVAAFEALGRRSSLRAMQLRGRLSAEMMRALLSHESKIEVLDLRDLRAACLDADAFEGLISAKSSMLRALDLTNNRLDAGALIRLLEAPIAARLETLVLHGTGLDADARRAVATVLAKHANAPNVAGLTREDGLPPELFDEARHRAWSAPRRVSHGKWSWREQAVV